MNKINTQPDFTDSRGEITDLLENESIDAITKITFTEGSVRANHYHKETIQWNYVIKGTVLLRTQKGDAPVEEIEMNEGDFIATEPNEAHALKAITDATILVFTKGPRGGKEYESDTFRLDVSLF
ncbi:MAG: cupin domain-containing protein [Sulfuricurvum sp.]|jgi:quercetin dioxygenase-like cupin family protein